MVSCDDLRKIYLLQDLTEDLLGTMLPFTELQLFEGRSVIYREGDLAGAFYMLRKGYALLEVEVSENVRISLGSIKPGYSFGWSALFPGSRYTAYAVCAEPCEVLAIPGEEFIRILDADHAVGYRVMEGIARILKRRLERRTNQFVTSLKSHPDIERLIAQEKKGWSDPETQ